MDGFFRFVADSLRAIAKHFATFEPLIQVGTIATFLTLFVLWRWGVAVAKKRRDAEWQQTRIRLMTTLLERGVAPNDAVRLLGVTLGNLDSDADQLTEEFSDAGFGLDVDNLLRAGSGDPTARLLKVLADNSYDTNDIETVVAAARSIGPIDARIVALVSPLADNDVEAAGIARILAGEKSTAAAQPASGA
jgi:hypothetical protein